MSRPVGELFKSCCRNLRGIKCELASVVLTLVHAWCWRQRVASAPRAPRPLALKGTTHYQGVASGPAAAPNDTCHLN